MPDRDGAFVALYHWRLHPGSEEKFRDAWSKMTRAIRSRFGSLGSRLHRAEDGSWYAYAQWPSRDAWERARGEDADPAAGAAMKECIAERFFAITLDVTDDL